MDQFVSSNPHAFLRPLYRRLAADRAFHLLAEQMQFDRLVDAAAEISERHAALMREYNAPTRSAMLRHLAKAESLRPGAEQVALWTLTKGNRVLTCVAVYLPNGVDVRALEDGDMRKTQLVKDGPHAEALAQEWLAKDEAMGWKLCDSVEVRSALVKPAPTTSEDQLSSQAPTARRPFSAPLDSRRRTREDE
jgi:hypothetical protein